MAIKNVLIGGSDWVDERVTNYDLNDTVNGVTAKECTLAGMNLIRCGIDRTMIYSKGQLEGVGDAFIDATGRNDYVFAGSTTATFDTNKYKNGSGTNNIVAISIPAGTFGTTIKRMVGVPFIEDWEIGANIQFMISNNSESTGWINYGVVGSFAAFTSQPNLLQAKLVQGGSLTAGYPSVRGVWTYAA